MALAHAARQLRSRAIEARQYPEADLRIESVNVEPSPALAGEEVFVSVDVADRGSPSSEFVAGVVIAYVGFSAEPLLWRCFVLQRGGDFTVDASTVSGTKNGSFVMPDEDVTINVRAGGYNDTYACDRQDIFSNRTDTASVTLERPTVDPNAVKQTACRASSTRLELGGSPDTIHVEVDVTNDNPLDVAIDASLLFGGSNIGNVRSEVIEANRTRTFNFAIRETDVLQGAGLYSLDFDFAVLDPPGPVADTSKRPATNRSGAV